MGWCSGTEIFDGLAKDIIQENEERTIRLLESIIIALENHDWDCQFDSGMIDNHLVQQAFKKVHPHWDFTQFDEENI